MRILKIFAVTLGIIIAALWVISTPHKAVKVGKPVIFGPVPSSITDVTAGADYIATSARKSAMDLPPYDEVVFNADETLAYVSAIDGWFWEVDLASKTARRFVDAPLMPAGARRAPDDDNVIYFCASYLYGEDYPSAERVGLYSIDIQTKAIVPLVLDVPVLPKTDGEAIVYRDGDAPRLDQNKTRGSTARPLAFCNDLDVSADGRRIYFTEPFAYGTPSMGGGGTFREAISLGQNGQVWRYDMDTGITSVVAQNFTFPDGILVETGEDGRDKSLLVTETVKFRLLRLYLTGPKADQSETVLENLPGMPDGLDRDAQGRIWIGMLKQRSATIDKIHKTPWIKHILLRLPSGLMPVSKETSILALSPDAGTPVFYTGHDGSVVTDISVVIPGRDALYLATVGDESHGLYTVPYPH